LSKSKDSPIFNRAVAIFLPELYEMVRTLSRNAGLPMPKLFIIPKEAPNAFATGRNPEHAVVAVTQGLLNIMDRDEVTGVLAHEMAHVKNRDILIGSIAATMAGAIMVLASMARWTAIFGGGGNNDDEGGGGAICGHDYSDGHITFARIFSGFDRCRFCGNTARIGPGAG
jgi:Zn-dependent protease with chaperone function